MLLGNHQSNPAIAFTVQEHELLVSTPVLLKGIGGTSLGGISLPPESETGSVEFFGCDMLSVELESAEGLLKPEEDVEVEDSEDESLVGGAVCFAAIVELSKGTAEQVNTWRITP